MILLVWFIKLDIFYKTQSIKPEILQNYHTFYLRSLIFTSKVKSLRIILVKTRLHRSLI